MTLSQNTRLKKLLAGASVADGSSDLGVAEIEVIKAYEHFFFHYTSSDLLIVNTSEIDFVDS